MKLKNINKAVMATTPAAPASPESATASSRNSVERDDGLVMTGRPKKVKFVLGDREVATGAYYDLTSLQPTPAVAAPPSSNLPVAQETANMPQVQQSARKHQRDQEVSKVAVNTEPPRKRSRSSEKDSTTSSTPAITTLANDARVVDTTHTTPHLNPQHPGARRGNAPLRPVRDNRSITHRGATVSSAYLEQLARQAEADEIFNLNETIIFRSGSELRRILVERTFAWANEQPQQSEQPQGPVRYPRESLASTMLSDKAYRYLGKPADKLSASILEEHRLHEMRLKEQPKRSDADIKEDRQLLVDVRGARYQEAQRVAYKATHDDALARLLDQRAFIDECYKALGDGDIGYLYDGQRDDVSRKTTDIALAAWKHSVNYFETVWGHAPDVPWDKSHFSHPNYRAPPPSPPSAPDGTKVRWLRTRKPAGNAGAGGATNGGESSKTRGKGDASGAADNADSIDTHDKGRKPRKPASKTAASKAKVEKEPAKASEDEEAIGSSEDAAAGKGKKQAKRTAAGKVSKPKKAATKAKAKAAPKAKAEAAKGTARADKGAATVKTSKANKNAEEEDTGKIRETVEAAAGASETTG